MAGGNPIPTAPGAMEGTVGPGSQAVSPSSPLPHRHPDNGLTFLHPASSSDHLSTLTSQRLTNTPDSPWTMLYCRPQTRGRVFQHLGNEWGKGGGLMAQCTQPCWASGEARNRAGTAGRGLGAGRSRGGSNVNVHHPPRLDTRKIPSRITMQTTTRWMYAVSSPVRGILQYAPLLRRYMYVLFVRVLDDFWGGLEGGCNGFSSLNASGWDRDGPGQPFSGSPHWQAACPG